MAGRVPYLDNFLSPILLTVPLQLLAYHVALLKNCDIDKPRTAKICYSRVTSINTFNEKLIQENKIYVIMYHYVREINKSNYPNLKGLEYKLFVKQVNYLSKKFNILSYDNFIEIINKKNSKKNHQYF